LKLWGVVPRKLSEGEVAYALQPLGKGEDLLLFDPVTAE
jgi:hypothetical protein